MRDLFETNRRAVSALHLALRRFQRHYYTESEVNVWLPGKPFVQPETQKHESLIQTVNQTNTRLLLNYVNFFSSKNNCKQCISRELKPEMWPIHSGPNRDHHNLE